MKLVDSTTVTALTTAWGALSGRDAVLAAAKIWLQKEKERLRQEFSTSGDALKLLGAHSALIDTLVAVLFALGQKESPATMAVVAVGGYGRRELFPYSDIDILFLHDGGDTSAVEAVAAYILYILWDSGLAVGQAHRNLDDTLALARADITIRTNLLDARFIAGDKAIFEHFSERFEREIVEGSAAEFIEKKLAERDVRHKRFGDSRYVLEPNVKEGKGGLRDLQTLWWLARYAYPISDLKKLVKMGLLTREEYRTFAHAREFLCKVRVHLHYLSEHAEERLTFDRQRQIANLMGYAHKEPHRAVERFMRRYFAAARMVGMATRMFCALLEEEKKRAPKKRLGWLTLGTWKPGGFVLDGERLTVKSAGVFERQPILMLDIFRVSQQQNIDIHPRALQWMARNLRRINRRVQNDKRAATIFLDILLADKDAESTLRKMSDAGVLGRYFPEFGRVTGQTQFNMYHVYTVDEHTLVAIGILHALENGERKEELPMATAVMKRIQQRRVLYLALLCHDIAKGGHGDHAELGVAITRKLAARLGFSHEEAETAGWLVQHHLLFSMTALKRDLADPKTLEDFIAVVQSPERLKLLFVLTVADMRAVGSSVWNAWKASLLRELFSRAEVALGSGEISLPQPKTDVLRAALKKSLAGWEEEEIDTYLSQTTPAYLTALNVARHAVVARMLKQAGEMEEPVLIDTHHDYERVSTEIIVATADQKGLFSKLAGAMALAGANITHAKIFTLKNDMAIDIFQVQDAAGDVFDRADRLAKMSVYIEQALSGELDLAAAFSERQKAEKARRGYASEGQVFIENAASNVHTLIEISGSDRPGLLYQVAGAMAELGLSIHSAHISTFGAQISDVFYVKDNFGMKIKHADKVSELRERLLAVINNLIPASQTAR
jgi:[protein-PII] uridylyltransferase